MKSSVSRREFPDSPVYRHQQSRIEAIRKNILNLLSRDRFVFLLALLAHFVSGRLLVGRQGSGLEWSRLADSILSGRGFELPLYGTDVAQMAILPPFYPYFLSAMKILGGSYWLGLLLWVQGIVFALGTVCAVRMARKILGADLARWAPLLLLTWPPLLVYANRLCPVVFHSAALPGLILLLHGALSRPTRRRFIKVGVAYGLLAYSLPSFLSSLPVLLPLMSRRLGSRRVALGRGTLILLTALLVVSPWLLRNAVVVGDFMPMSSNLGHNLLGSHNEHANQSYNVLCEAVSAQEQLLDREALAELNEAEFDRLQSRRALSYMAAHPVLTLRRTLVRAVGFWCCSPWRLVYDRTRGIVNIILMSLLLPLALLGLRVTRADGDRLMLSLCYGVMIWATLFYMNFVVRGRYSLPFNILLLIFALSGIDELRRMLASRRIHSTRSDPRV